MMNRVQPENVHSTVFTPREYQVELVDACLRGNTLAVLGSGATRTFLTTMVTRELAHLTYSKDEGGEELRTLITGWCGRHLVHIGEAIQQNTNLAVTTLTTLDQVAFWSKQKWGHTFNEAQVVVLTVEVLEQVLELEAIPFEWLNLLVITDAHRLFSSPKLAEVISSVGKRCRVIGMSSPVLRGATCTPPQLSTFLTHLQDISHCTIDTASEIVSVLRFVNKPVEKIVMCHTPKLDDASAVEGEIRREVQKAMDFLGDHRYNLVEIYGQEYEEFCRDIPDPNTEPRNILLDFLDVLNNLGVWCADRAALYALVEVEKLKKKTAYDRHYLLLCMIFSVMAKIRAIVEHTFDEYSELDQILKFSSPKVLRLVEILRQVRPLNFVDPRKRREKLEALQAAKALEERVEEQEKKANSEDKEEQNESKEGEVEENDTKEGERSVNTDDQGCQGATLECEAVVADECKGSNVECCVTSESVDTSSSEGNKSGHLVPGGEANNVVIVNAVQSGPVGPPKGECDGRSDSVCNKSHVFVDRGLGTVEGSIGKLNIGNMSHNNGCENLGNCSPEDKEACDPLCNGDLSAKVKPRGSSNNGDTSLDGGSSPEPHTGEVKLSNGDVDFSRCNGYQHSENGDAQSETSSPVVNGALSVANNHCINKPEINGVHDHLTEEDSKDESSMQQLNSKKERNYFSEECSVSKMNRENLAKSNLTRKKEVRAIREGSPVNEDKDMQMTIVAVDEHDGCGVKPENNLCLKEVDGKREAAGDEILRKKVQFCSQEVDEDEEELVHVNNVEEENGIHVDKISKSNKEQGTEVVTETKTVQEEEIIEEVDEGSEEPKVEEEEEEIVEKVDEGSEEPKVEEEEENPSSDSPKKCQGEEDANTKEPTQVPEPISEGRSEGLADTLVQLLPGAWIGRGRKRRDDQKEKAKVHNPDDPDSVCGLIFVQHRTTAKIIYRLLKELSDIGGDFAWIFPQYTVELKENLKDDPRAAEAEHKKQEEVLRRFRHHECNILVSTRVLEEGVDIPQCNLVVRFDPPPDYRSYVHSCGRARGLESHYLLLVTSDVKEQFLLNRATYSAFEKVLLSRCSSVEEGTDREVVAEEANVCVQPYNTPGGATVTMSSAIALLNKYCAKLPSDTFTRLTAMWEMEEKEENSERVEGGEEQMTKLYRCSILLPINSPLKGVIQGPWLGKAALAKMGAALECCQQLHTIGELDDQLQPVGKESMRLDDHLCAPPADDLVPEGMPRPGTTKRRQYYYKKVSDCLTGSQPSAMVSLFVYKLDMVLTCPIPDEQNTRGRKIYHPEHSPRAFGLLSTQPISQVSGFPVFTRSGEVMVRVKEVQRNVVVSIEQLVALQHFHTFTFTHVLRLEKYPIKFHPTNAQASFYVVPLNMNNGCEGIDWEFVKVIEKEGDPHPTAPSDEERSKFVFKRQLYEDAVVMPWYRNQDQPQYFYVAEICTHLNPQSDFPDAGFETFEKYYLTKYGLQICNLSQPLLDVDHTSGRLNLLTPRHVNRKGVALPTTSEETKRAKRENLQQKQILVPELCTIHPFPASLWRKAVCLPTILYRMNALLLADQLRLSVASEVGLGLNTLVSLFEWPPLDFGWSLADVLKRSQEQQSIEDKNKDDKSDDEASKCKIKEEKEQDTPPSKKRLTKKGLDMEIGTWSNDMAVDPPTPPGGSEAGDDFEIDTFDPDLALPDNLTLLEGNVEEVEGELGADWGTGIMERKTRSSRSSARSGAVVRVGSPSNFESDGWDCFGGGGYDGYGDYEMYDRGSDDTDMESDMDEDEDQVSEDKLWEDEAAKKHSAITADDCASEDEIDLTWPSEEDPLLQDNQEEFVHFLEEKKDEILKSSMYLSPDEPLVIEKAHRKKAAEMAKEGEANDSVPGALTKDDKLTEVEPEVGEVPEKQQSCLESPVKEVGGAVVIVTDKEGVREVEVKNGLKVKEMSETLLAQKAAEEVRMGIEMSEELRANTEVCKEINVDTEVVAVDEAKSEVPVAKPGCDFTQSCDSLQQSTSCSSTNIVVDREATLTLGRLEGEGKVYPLEGDFSFDLQPDLLHHPGPPPSVLLQALTMSNANDGINLERLETIGDSFLKYAITTYLYCTYPHRHEGKLSYLRSKQVSNLNLYRLGKRKGLGECMVATKFEPHDNWLPPGYFVPRELEEALIDSGVPAGHWNMADLPGLHDLASDEIRRLVQERSEQIKKNKAEQLTSDLMASQNPAELPIFIPYNLLTQHSIPDKSIADCVEALIGAYLTTCGPRGALLFMSWLGIRVLPCCPLAQEECKVRVMYEQLQPPRSPLHSCKEPNAEVQLDLLLSGYNVLEEKLGYYFRDRSYLLQAFTHASYYKNTLTDCYQRLEFLGDAVLDYLITRHLYEDKRQHSPGALTDLRSALVNNTIFASLAVKYNYHKYFRHFSPGLDRVIRDFVKMQEENGHKVSEEYYFMEEDECEEAEDIEVPKALGDVFESVAGAIFLDSGMSLDAVWSVYYPMMRQEIEQFSGVVPKSPIRELLEMEPETAKFGKPERLVDGKVRVAVEIFGKGSFSGVGRNYRIAKSTAAKRALRHLKKLQMATNNLSL